MSRLTVSTSLLAGMAVLSATIGPAQGTVGTTGDVSPDGAGTQGDSWAAGVILRVGSNADGTLNVEAGEVLANMRERGS